MSNEIVRRVDSDLIPHWTSTGFLERRTFSREARRAVFDARLEGLIRLMRLGNAFEAQQRQIELHIQLARDIEYRLETTDSPLQRIALERAFENWLRVSDAIVSGAGRLF